MYVLSVIVIELLYISIEVTIKSKKLITQRALKSVLKIRDPQSNYDNASLYVCCSRVLYMGMLSSGVASIVAEECKYKNNDEIPKCSE